MMDCSSGCNTTLNECNGCTPEQPLVQRQHPARVHGRRHADGPPDLRTTGATPPASSATPVRPGLRPAAGRRCRPAAPTAAAATDSPCANGCNNTRREMPTPATRPVRRRVRATASAPAVPTDWGRWTAAVAMAVPPAAVTNACRASANAWVPTLRTCSSNGTWSEMRCQAPSGGTATCSDAMCGFTCTGGVPACNNNTACPKLSWDFENDLEGVTISAMHTAASGVEPANGPVPQFQGAGARRSGARRQQRLCRPHSPFCMGQVANLRGKQLSLASGWREIRAAWTPMPGSSMTPLGIVIPIRVSTTRWCGSGGSWTSRWPAPGLDEMTQAVILYVYTGGLRAGLPSWRRDLAGNAVRRRDKGPVARAFRPGCASSAVARKTFPGPGARCMTALFLTPNQPGVSDDAT